MFMSFYDPFSLLKLSLEISLTSLHNILSSDIIILKKSQEKDYIVSKAICPLTTTIRAVNVV